MKACQVFKTKKEFKIITMYKTDTGSYKLSDPVFICPLEVDKKKLSDIIFQSLSCSISIKNPNTSYSKELLKKISESSYNNLYKKSKCCLVFWEDNTIVIEPQLFSIKLKALETNKKRVVTIFDSPKSLVVEEIMRVLDEEV